MAHAQQLLAISSLEELMLTHKRVAEQYLNQMRELLESRILPFFQQILSYGGCSRQVVRLLKENIIKDLAKITNEVSRAVMIFLFQTWQCCVNACLVYQRN